MKLSSITHRIYNFITNTKPPTPIPWEMEEAFHPLFRHCEPYTLTSVDRMYGLYKATEYVSKASIPGTIVECGVFKGGSIMLAALTLLKFEDTDRELYLYDTFKGMTKPTDEDLDMRGEAAHDVWKASQRTDYNEWTYAPLDFVQKNMNSTHYPPEKIKYVQGPVEETLPEKTPEKIALLRLDTDWYESTYHELIHLYPLLSPGGVLIIDDYGHFKGTRKAVDQYIEENNLKLLLNRIDYSARVAVKPGLV